MATDEAVDYDARLLARRKASLARLDRWAYVLDEAIPIPGTQYHIGLDSVIGLVPGIGDFAGLTLASGLIGEAFWARAPKRVWVPMTANVGLDFLVGLVPVIGDIFDVTYQANTRNAAIFRRWLEAETQPPPEDNASGSSLLSAKSVTGGVVVAVIAGLVVWQLMF